MQTAAEKRALGDEASRVVEDPNRPGPSRVRLDPEQIPVWALIGQARAIAEERNAALTDDVVVRELAADYAISIAAAQVALDWYEEHPHAIDTVLADNAAAFR